MEGTLVGLTLDSVDQEVKQYKRYLRDKFTDRKMVQEAVKYLPNIQFHEHDNVTISVSWRTVYITIPWNIGFLDWIAKRFEEAGWKMSVVSEREENELNQCFRFTHEVCRSGVWLTMRAKVAEEKDGQLVVPMNQTCRVVPRGTKIVEKEVPIYDILCEGEDWERVDAQE